MIALRPRDIAYAGALVFALHMADRIIAGIVALQMGAAS